MERILEVNSWRYISYISLFANSSLMKGWQMLRWPNIVFTEYIFTHHLVQCILLF